MDNKNMTTTTLTSEEITSLFQKRIKNTFNEHIGIEFVAYEDGYCKTKLKVRPEFINPIGGLHGGLLYTIADSTAGVAAVHLGSGNTVTTVNGDMQFMRPALNLDYIFAEARIVKDGKRLVFLDVYVTDKEGTILAKGNFTFARIFISGFEMPTL